MTNRSYPKIVTINYKSSQVLALWLHYVQFFFNFQEKMSSCVWTPLTSHTFRLTLSTPKSCWCIMFFGLERQRVVDALFTNKKKKQKTYHFHLCSKMLFMSWQKKCLGSFWLLDSQLFSAVYRTHISTIEPELYMDFWVDCSKRVSVKSNGYYYKR